MNAIFLKIINMSISASWLVLTVMILRLVLKKAPKWVNVLLWGIVAVRLICPFSFESSLSLIPSAETVPLNIETNAAPAIDSGIDAINNAVNPIIGAVGNSSAGARPFHITVGICEYVWIFGMLALAAYTTVSYWRLCRKVDTAVRYKENIFRSENVISPFVLGIFKPRIYLPFELDGQALEHVVAHERAHIHRKDHWWKFLGFLLLTVHWFNPLMWIAYILLCRDIELACDEKVISELSCDRRADYTQALLACSISRRTVAAYPLSFGEVGVKQRVRSVMNYKKPAFWAVIPTAVVCVCVAVCFLTDPKQDSHTLRIVVPSGSQEEFVYSQEEISAINSSIKIRSGDKANNTEILLLPVNKTTDDTYTTARLANSIPVTLEAEKGIHYKVGVNIQNPTDEDILVYVEVENAEVYVPNGDTHGYKNNESVSSKVPKEMAELLGEWVPDVAYTKNCNGDLPLRKIFGSTLGCVGASLRLGDNGSVEYTMGALTGKGRWHTDGDSERYVAELSVYPSKAYEAVTFYKFSESPDSKSYLVLDYEGYSIYWKRSPEAYVK